MVFKSIRLVTKVLYHLDLKEPCLIFPLSLFLPKLP
jgi:hypothetical protein